MKSRTLDNWVKMRVFKCCGVPNTDADKFAEECLAIRLNYTLARHTQQSDVVWWALMVLGLLSSVYKVQQASGCDETSLLTLACAVLQQHTQVLATVRVRVIDDQPHDRLPSLLVPARTHARRMQFAVRLKHCGAQPTRCFSTSRSIFAQCTVAGI